MRVQSRLAVSRMWTIRVRRIPHGREIKLLTITPHPSFSLRTIRVFRYLAGKTNEAKDLQNWTDLDFVGTGRTRVSLYELGTRHAIRARGGSAAEVNAAVASPRPY